MTMTSKAHWVCQLLAASALVASLPGCATPEKNNDVIHGEEFVADESSRSLNDTMTMQAANAARADSTLHIQHFDAEMLNSLGEEHLDLILRSGQSLTPLTVYLDLPAGEVQTGHRQQTVTAYLKDRGLTDEQIEIKVGSNPAYNTAVAQILAAQAAPAPAGGGQPQNVIQPSGH